MTAAVRQIIPPVSLVDTRRIEVSPTLDPKRRRNLGQFMTPGRIAEFMAAMFETIPCEVRLLDAGAGMGAVTAAFATEACRRDDPPESIDVTAYAIDESLGAILRSTPTPLNKHFPRLYPFVGRI